MRGLFARDADAAGYGAEWRAYAAGRLATDHDVVERLADEPVPSDEAAAGVLAARYGLDAWVLWLVVSHRT